MVWDPDGPNASGDLTAAQNAFGQGLSLTAIQLVAGYAAFANGGLLVTPHVVEGWTDPDGTYHAAHQPPAERIIRAETAETMLGCSRTRSTRASPRAPQIPGYTVAGKTGTAQIAGPVRSRARTASSSSAGTTSRAGSTRASSASCPRVTRKLVTLVLIHRPAGAGGRHARPPGDRVRPAHATGARLSRHPAGPAAGAGRPAVTLLDSPEVRSGVRVPPTIRLEDLLAATGGRLIGPAPPASFSIAGASVDSRRVTPGSIFVALRGERADGHAFVADALRAGAVAALVERPVDLPADIDAPQVVVADALRALQELAAWWRSRHAVRVVGITGSTGKTIAKEITADVLSRGLATLRNAGNLNSETGLPMTLLRLEPRTRRRCSR